MPTHAILLISGDEALAHQITAWLTDHTEYVLAGHCQTLESAARCCLTAQAALMLVDLETPNAMERERWADLMRASPQAPILALVTSATTDIARQRATHAGALRFLARDGGATALSENLEAALQHAVETWMARALASFTTREREILLLIADGLTNPAIAQRLVVSEKTVKRHVSTIMEKLGVDNRVQVARWAWEHGLASRRNNS
jgi:DNA-binding NarL/FixJ family response regulator